MIEHLSYSGFNTWKECGEKFRLTRIAKVPEVPGYALVGGRAVHTTTEINDKAAYGLCDPTDFKTEFEKEIADTVAKTGAPESEWRISGKVTTAWPNKEDKDFWSWNGPVFVKNYSDWISSYPGTIWITPDGNPAIELAIDFKINDVHIVGYIDRIFQEPNGTLKVVDIKSGKTTPSDGMQLGIYSRGLNPEWPTPTLGAYYMARENKLIGDYNLIKLRGRIQYEFKQAWKDINNGSFLPKETYMCKFCSVRPYCWAKDGEFSEEMKPF